MIWSNDLAYVVGLIATDGNLSKDGRHLIFVSKDLGQIHNFSRILGLRAKLRIKRSGYTGRKDNYSVQFSDVAFYRFLNTIGLYPNKSKTMREVGVPDEYFADFVRGCLDGDGYTHSYWDKRWKSSFLFYLGFTSASIKFMNWMKGRIYSLYDINGSIKYSGKSTYQLLYAKRSSLILVKKLYYNDKITCLSRKKLKIQEAVDIISRQAGMLKLVDRHA